MSSPFVVPLAAYAMAALIVVIVCLVKIRDKELEIQQTLHRDEMEHQLKMRELGRQLKRYRTDS